ncbi:MAG: glycosyltransferase family 4 protein [Devosia sp.]
MVDQLRASEIQQPNVRLDFAVSRGAHILASLYNLPRVAARIVLGGVLDQIDVVHLNLASNSSAYRKLLLSYACRLVRIPYVIHLHGGGFRDFWVGLPRARKRAIDGLFKNAGAIVVLGDASRPIVAAQVPETAAKIFTVPNATQRRPKAAGSGEIPNILFLGRLGKSKGVPDLLQALAGLPRSLSWTAVIAGDGDVRETLRTVAEFSLSNRVTVPGWVGTEDVERLIEKGDILVLPSYEENLPMSVIEGMAAGLAVVATPVGETGDIVRDGITGLLVKPGDVGGLRTALERLLSDADLRTRLGSEAQAFHRQRLDADGYVARLSVPWLHAAGFRPAKREQGETHSVSGL